MLMIPVKIEEFFRIKKKHYSLFFYVDKVCYTSFLLHCIILYPIVVGVYGIYKFNYNVSDSVIRSTSCCSCNTMHYSFVFIVMQSIILLYS